jgi:hypothetical protein
MAIDYSLYADGLNSPAQNAEVVVPHDSNDLGQPSRGLVIGVGGTISVETVGGQSAVVLTVATGAVLALRVTRINNTGTSATNMVSLY